MVLTLCGMNGHSGTIPARRTIEVADLAAARIAAQDFANGHTDGHVWDEVTICDERGDLVDVVTLS